MRVRVLCLFAALAVAACSSGPPYNETRHRAEVEAVLGAPIAHWTDYVAANRGICDQSEETFSYTVALSMDRGTYKALRVNVKHLCSDRAGEIDETVADVSKDPCAPPITESDQLIYEASGCADKAN